MVEVAQYQAFAERPGRHLELLGLERSHSRTQHNTACNDLECTVCGDPWQSWARLSRDARQTRHPIIELRTAQHDAVSRANAVLGGSGQPGQRTDGLRRSDNVVWVRQRGEGIDSFGQYRLCVGLQLADLVGGWGVVVQKIDGRSAGAER